MAETHQMRTPQMATPSTKSYNQLNQQAIQRAKTCKMATVPSLSHLKSSDYNLVYEPSDDTFLMLDALAHEFDDDGSGGESTNKVNRDRVKTTLELGCGTGVNTIYLAQILAKHKHDNGSNTTEKEITATTTPIIHHVTDINKDAIRIALQTAKENNIHTTTITSTMDSNHTNLYNTIIPHQCDLATPLLQSHSQTIDVLLFNPPYVPTPNEEVGSDEIEASWAGGVNGRVVLDRALPQIRTLMSRPHGVAYVIVVDDNRPEEIRDLMEGGTYDDEDGNGNDEKDSYRIKLNVWPLVRRKARNEYLTVLKFEWVGRD